MDHQFAPVANGEESSSNGEESSDSEESDSLYMEPDVDIYFSDEGTLKRLAQNDSGVEGLRMHCLSSIDDWGRRFGDAIGRNDHLKVLEISDIFSEPELEEEEFQISPEQIVAFLQGLARNTSIEVLKLQASDVSEMDIFGMLSPFFEHNHNLRAFNIGDRCTAGAAFSPSIALALSKCAKNSLRQVHIEIVPYDHDESVMSDGHTSKIVEALHKQNNMQTLSLESKCWKGDLYGNSKVAEETIPEIASTHSL